MVRELDDDSRCYKVDVGLRGVDKLMEAMQEIDDDVKGKWDKVEHNDTEVGDLG